MVKIIIKYVNWINDRKILIRIINILDVKIRALCCCIVLNYVVKEFSTRYSGFINYSYTTTLFVCNIIYNCVIRKYNQFIRINTSTILCRIVVNNIINEYIFTYRINTSTITKRFIICYYIVFYNIISSGNKNCAAKTTNVSRGTMSLNIM